MTDAGRKRVIGTIVAVFCFVLLLLLYSGVFNRLGDVTVLIFFMGFFGFLVGLSAALQDEVLPQTPDVPTFGSAVQVNRNEGSVTKNWKVGDLVEGRYKIHSIRKGGMGLVFLCSDDHTKTPIAIKTFQDKYFLDTNAVNRFLWESEAWIRLGKHNNIVRAYFVNLISERPYIFLELISGDKTYGPDLSVWIKLRGLNLPITLDFAIQFCLGMEHAETIFHEMGKIFVHRDIKPGNIMVTENRTVKVTDFGLVKTFKDDINLNIVTEKLIKQTQLTKKFEFSIPELVIGTAPYMSPEQCKGEANIDGRSDIYSFGCVLYEMLTSTTPFKCVSFNEYITCHTECLPLEPRQVSPNIPKELNNVVMRCLEKNPLKRFQSFRDLRDVLTEIYFHETGTRVRTEYSADELNSFEWYNKGTSLGNLGMPEEAIECFDKSIALRPNYALAWINKGAALYQLRRIDESIACCDKGIQIDQRIPEAWINKARSLLDLGKPDEALFCINQAIELHSISRDALFYRGTVLCRLGRYDEAIVTLDKVLNINPCDALAWGGKAAAYEGLGNFKEAISAIENFVKYAPPQYAEHVTNAEKAMRQLKSKIL